MPRKERKHRTSPGPKSVRAQAKKGRGPDKRPRKPGTGRWQQRHLAYLPALQAHVERMAAYPGALPQIREPKKRKYVLALAETGARRTAARVAGVHPSTPYTRQWQNDEVLQAEVKVALEVAADRLEAEAFRRAVEGVEQPTGWYRRKPGGTVRRYSDVLAIFLLKGLRPETYQERVQMRGALAHLDLSLLPDEAIERIANGEHVMSVLASMVPRAGEALPGLMGPQEATDKQPDP